MYFTHYKFVPGFGFYGLGLIHLLGNLTMSATAALRSLVDAGQFANLPGGFKARGVRVVGNNDPIAPGEFREIDATGMDLNKAIVNLPYREPSGTLYQLLGTMTEMGQKFADSADQIVANATNYGPVGTTLALLEAGAKFFSAIHKRLHHSQKHEFRILARINRDFLPPTYPYQVPGMSSEVFKKDFDDRIDVIPVSDPNTPSAAHRLAMAQMVLQLSEQAPPGMYNVRQVHISILNAANIQNPERFIIPETEPKAQSPVADIESAINNMPIKAFPQQDHSAHIQIKTAFIEDPLLGENERLKGIIPVLESNIREHMFLQYQQQMEGLVRIGSQEAMQQGIDSNDPAILNQIAINAAKEILQANQMQSETMGDDGNLQQQGLALEAEKVGIQKDELRLKASKEAGDLALENRKLDLEEMDIRQKGVTETSKTEERNLDRRLRAAKDVASLSSKTESNRNSESTKLVIEALKNAQNVATQEMKEGEITEERLGMLFDSLIRGEQKKNNVVSLAEGGEASLFGSEEEGEKFFKEKGIDVEYTYPTETPEGDIVDMTIEEEFGEVEEETDKQPVPKETVSDMLSKVDGTGSFGEEVVKEKVVEKEPLVKEKGVEKEPLVKEVAVDVLDIALKQIRPYEVSSKKNYDKNLANKVYPDDKGFKTIGIGHRIKDDTLGLLKNVLEKTDTEALEIIEKGGLSWSDANKLFKHELINYRDSAANLVNNFTTLSPNLQAGLINLNYRGDLAGSPVTVGLIEAGKFKEAAVELLKHKEYLERKARKPKGDSVTRRLEFVAELLKKEV